jgi:hypothetical protein
VGDNANIDFGTGNFTLVWRGSLPDWTPTVITYFMAKYQDGTHHWLLKKSGGAGTGFVVLLNGITFASSVADGLTDGTVAEIVAVVTVGTVNTTVDFYLNGIALGTQQTAANPGSVDNTGSIQILGVSDIRNAGVCHFAATYNRALTAAEVLALYRNGIDYADKWGNQTSIVTGNDSTFAGASNWVNSNFDTYDETTGGVLTLAGTVAWRLCTLPQANAATVIGKKYRLVVTASSIVGTWYVYDVSGSTQALTTTPITTDGTKTYEFTATTTGGLAIRNATDTASIVLDNFLLYEIGATLALESEGIQFDKWHDSSSNALDASYPTVGTSLLRLNTKRCKQPTPTAKTVAVTLTIAELLTGIITGTHTAGATAAYTLPTGTLCDAGGYFAVNSYFDWSLINLSAAAIDTITVTAGVDHTIVGNPIVQSAHADSGGKWGNSAIFRTCKTAANTFVTYRIG